MTPAARLACAAPHCWARGRHAQGCADEQCSGCLPRLAADGLRLCTPCVRRLAEDARSVAELHGELELRLMPAGAGGERVDRSESWRTPDPRVVEVRTEIRHVLVGWCRLIAEERGIALPEDDVTAMGAYVGRHATWLAAQPYAGEPAGELRSLVTRAWRVAYPSGARVAEVGACPMEGCGGTLRSVVHAADAMLPAVVRCDADEAHEWGAAEWHALGKAMRRVA